MKIILSSRRHQYLAMASIFLITVALIMGMVGCGGDSVQYDLTITSTTGGSVTTPGEGSFTYNEGAVVNLVAEAEEGYYFIKWTGDVGTIGDVNAIETSITMNGHYSITVNFVPSGVEPIWDWYDLDTIRNNLSASYLLMNDLDSTTDGYTELASPTANNGTGWQPIGTLEEPFTGLFDGQGYEIRDLFINSPEELGIGFFGCVGEVGVVRNIGFVDANVTGELGVGILAGINGGTVSNSYATGNATGGDAVGGLVGGSCGPELGCPGWGSLSNCHATANVAGIDYVGGLVGANEGPVSDCYAIGKVTGTQYVGGLVGMTIGEVTDCYAVSSVIGNDLVGGLAGIIGGEVTDCYATGNVNGNDYVGGLAGASAGLILGFPGGPGTLSNSYATTNVAGIDYVGGLVGVNEGPVSDCYARGGVTGNFSVGGLMGANVGNVTNCYATSSVIGTSSAGGLVGENTIEDELIEGTVTDSFWDTETSGQATSDGGTGKTTAEMQDIATFSGATWDITAVANSGTRNPLHIWNIVDDVTYPFLSWEP